MKKEIILYQANYITDRASAARRLRSLADKIEHRGFKVAEHTVVLPREVECKVEFEGDGSSGELEFEIGWDAWEKMGPSALP